MEKRPITSIDDYIAQFTGETQEILTKLRVLIRDSAPEATEKISYQMPTFALHGNLVHFAAYDHHIGFYPTPSGIEKFKVELSPYKMAKGSVQFPINNQIPYDIIKRIVEFRVMENKSNNGNKKKKQTT